MAGATDGVVLIQTACGSRDEAEAIAAALVAERLAACVQLWPVASRYVWQGAVERADEVLVQAKTTRARVAAAQARIAALHSYEVPEMIVVAVAGGVPTYLDWVRESVGRALRPPADSPAAPRPDDDIPPPSRAATGSAPDR